MVSKRRQWFRSWRPVTLAAVAMLAALVQLGGSSAAPGDPPNLIGDWSAPVGWPIVAVHMSLEPTGQVFALDGFAAGTNSEHLWDPTSGNFIPVPYGRNLFCAGHIQLADGRTLLVGGHINANEGLADTTIFNPVTRTYFRGPDMTVGRWYPTATQLPDGRVLTFAGDNIQINQPGDPAFRESSVNSLPSIYNPTTNTWTDLTTARLTSPLYPYMFVLSDGRVFDAGPDKITRILNPATATWSVVGTSPIDGMSAVMYRPNKIMKSGSWSDPGFRGTNTFNAHARTAVIDMSAGTPAWRETAAMNRARAYHNLTLLPDGTVLASGGGSTSDGVDIENSVLPAEIWNPDTETWTEVDSLQNGRLYHSTALLLPDGRVLMAGGGQLPSVPTIVNQRNAEIYSPPYLFKGPRPTITAAPSAAAYGASFDVTTPNAASIDEGLPDPAALGHARDRHEPAFPVPQLHHRRREAHRQRARQREPRSARRLHAVRDRLERRAVGGFDDPCFDGGRRHSADRADRVDCDGWPGPGRAELGRGDRRRRDRAVQRPSRDHRRLHAEHREPRGPADRYDLHRHRACPPAPTTTASPPRTSPATSSAASNEASGVVPAGPPPGLVAVVRLRRGERFDDRRSIGRREQRHAREHHLVDGRPLRQGALVQRHERVVTVADSNALDLTSGMTIEGWVRPTVSSDWQTLIVKERPGELVYGALREHGRQPAPVAGDDRRHRAPPERPCARFPPARGRTSRRPSTAPRSGCT